jgi:uncharacterized membrane protein YidH (DUF202 family)
MLSTTPIATDHVYKFYALFGLFLLITSIITIAYANTYYNDLIAKHSIDAKVLSFKENLTQEEQLRKALSEQLSEMAEEGRNFYNRALNIILSGSILLMGFGFWKWQRVIQPKQDILLDLQIEKLKREIHALNK